MITLSRCSLDAIAGAASFGMAFAASGMTASNCFSCPELFKQFDSVEFPVEILELKEASKLLAGAINGFQYLHIGSIIDAEVARNLPYASESLYQEFSSYTERIFPALSSIGIHTVTFDPGMNAVLTDPKAQGAAMRLLKQIAPQLLRNRIQLLLPFSLPCRGAETPDLMVRFLRSSMIPNLKVRLDIYPHEIPRNAMNPDALAGTLMLEVRSVVFRYDAGSGNFPVPEHVRPWLERFYDFGMRGPFLSAPSCFAPDRFPHEAEIWSDLVKKLRETSRKG